MSSGPLLLVFSPAAPTDYLAALSRLRWRRAFSGWAGPPGTLEIEDPKSVPAPGAARGLAEAAALFPDAGIVPSETLAEEAERRWEAPPLSTLSQIERLPEAFAAPRVLSGRPASAAARFLPSGGSPARWVVAGSFRIVSMPRRFGPRPEIADQIPEDARRVLDVGCGAGELGAELRRRRPGIEWTGIEIDPGLAREARGRGIEIIEGEALAALGALAGSGRTFDAIVLADALEHFEDPGRILAGCRDAAAPNAAVVVSVPNVAFFRIAAELVAGRFDLLGAGPLDAGHLRWFTRRSLGETLAEASIREVVIRPVASAEDGTEFFRDLAEAGIPVAHEDVSAVQWVALGRFP